ncbi:NYN domain-containing protein [Enorma phocaeensis]|uniref:NYN domain-containing protein n=1 Tax=Enorma phocaeensis TaxID=1871019 RepID=UPI000C84854B|nr:NYN domain-containing protein [Enorma phocaeensis]
MAVDATRELRFAILIDADNVSDKYIKIILDEVSNSGVATYKRIYGDWTSQRLASWKGCLLENSIIPIQQYSYTYGKSSTDSAMIIDAMDILYSGNVDGFAIVSSDSDFTRLAARLRESGMQVIGMGEQKTPEPFISACNQFKYLDLLYAARRLEDAADDDAEDADEGPDDKRTKRGGRTTKHAPKAAASTSGKGRAAVASPDAEQPSLQASKATSRSKRAPGDLGGDTPGSAQGSELQEPSDFNELSRAARRRHMKRIRSAVDAIVDQFSDEEGWVFLGTVGSELPKRLSDFDVRNYGYKKLSPFLKSMGVYEFDERAMSSGSRAVYLRTKEQ